MDTNRSIVFLKLLILSTVIAPVLSEDPVPTPWPKQFHALLIIDNNITLEKVDLWYDWVNGRNFNIIQKQHSERVLYDLEWNNGTSFYYTLDENKECKIIHFEVGILRPDWLDGATYLGKKTKDGFTCNVWTKADFIWYYEDVATKTPVHWRFYTGRMVHVMTFEVGAYLDDEKWQAPVYCFESRVENSDYGRMHEGLRFVNQVLTNSFR